MRTVLVAMTLCGSLCAQAQTLTPVHSRSDRRTGAMLVLGAPGVLGRTLPAAAADAALFAELAARTLGFDARRVERLPANAGPDAVTSALARLAELAKDPARPVWIYAAGPARCDGKTVTLLLREGQQVPVEALLRALGRGAERTLVLDVACEGLPPRRLAADDRGLRVLAALGGGGKRELDLDRAHGLWTSLWVRGLTGAADLDADGEITWAEWTGYARRRLRLHAAPDAVVHLGAGGDAALVVDPLLPTPLVPTASPETTAPEPTELDVTWEGGEGELWLNGRRVGSTPALLRGLQPGRYQLEVRTRTERVRAVVFVDAGMKRTLDLPRGERVDPLFEVLTEPPGAALSLAGRSVGQSPFKGPYPAGSHYVVASLPGYRTRRETLTFGEGATSHHLELEPVQWMLAGGLLMPQLELTRRVHPRAWVGGRMHSLFPGFGPGGPDLLMATIYFGGAALLRYQLTEHNDGDYGFDIIGGAALELAELRVHSRFNSQETILGSSVIGFAAWWWIAQVQVELRASVFEGEPLLFVCPSLMLRHQF